MSGYDTNTTVYLADAPTPGWYQIVGETHGYCLGYSTQHTVEHLIYCDRTNLDVPPLRLSCAHPSPFEPDGLFDHEGHAS